jgi:hypothetical protein
MNKRLAIRLEPFCFGLNATLRAASASSRCHSLGLFERSRLFIAEHNHTANVRQYATLPSQHRQGLGQPLGVPFVKLDVVSHCEAGRWLYGCTLKRCLGARDN